MATVTSSDSRQNRNLFSTNANPKPARIGYCLDDMDVLTLRRQYANLDLFEQSTLSNSAEDIPQLDQLLYPYPIEDIEDDDLPYDEDNSFDYTAAIQERLKKANEELQHDQTPVELKHSQRVSFDAVVKAVDILQDPSEHEHSDPIARPSTSPVIEESIAIPNSPRGDDDAHEYTVPLNDTQPKSGLSLLEKIKDLQYHGHLPEGERWTTTTPHPNHNGSENSSATSLKFNENSVDSKDTSNSTPSKNSMIVAVNGRIEMLNEDDYTAKYQPISSNKTESSSSSTKNKNLFVPTPPKEPKQKQDASQRPFLVRPKSSSEKKNKTETNNRPRPKSAGVTSSLATHTEKSSSGVDFNELLRKAAEKRRAELKEERRQREAAEEKRQKELAKAKECYERWLQDKDSERRRLAEEKRMEKEEKEIRQAEEEKRLAELREKSYKDWLERKAQEIMIADEFKKLKANEETGTSGGSSSSINSNHRAFHRWLREKYEKSLEEKRQSRLEAKRQRRRQRRSIKRHQLHQDLQLAKSYGYSS